MAEPNLAAAVSAIIVSYQTAKDLTQSLSLRGNHWDKHRDTEAKEQALSAALIAGENQVADRYAANYGDVGEAYRLADKESQSKLFRIAQLVKMRVVDTLQNAVQSDDGEANYARITQDAVLFRKAALGVLEELHQRLLSEDEKSLAYIPTVHPLETRSKPEKVAPPEPPEPQVSDDKSSTYSKEPCDHAPAITIEPDPEPTVQRSQSLEFEDNATNKPRLSRLFSRRRARTHETSSTASLAPASLSLLKAFGGYDIEAPADFKEKRKSKASEKMWYTCAEVPVIMDFQMARVKRESTTLGAFDKWNTERPVTSLGCRPDSETLGRLEAPFRPAPLRRQASASTTESSTGRTRSDSNGSHGSSTPITSPTSETSSADWSFLPKSAESSTGGRSSDEAPAIPVKSPLRLMPSHKRALTASSSNSSELSRPVSTAPTSAPSIISAPPITIAPSSFNAEVSLMGRPTKKNNYWGFCKGAWATRESIQSGLKIATQPSGMYTNTSHWRCRTCSFHSEPIKRKDLPKKASKDQTDLLDINVYAAGGVLYRWIFLAKSHVKCKSSHSVDGDFNFGCVFCCVVGRTTSVYGSVDTLMGHIVGEHVADMQREDVQAKTKCVYGRLAGTQEEFDICVLGPAPTGRKRNGFAPLPEL